MSKIDRFEVTIQSLSEAEKADIYTITTELTNILEERKKDPEGSQEKGETLEQKLNTFVDLFN